MQPAGRLEALVERAEYHRENGAEGTMKAGDRIGKYVRVLLDCSGNPRVRELELSARPAPKNIAASRLMRQVIDCGPNMPESEPDATARNTFSSRSRPSDMTMSSGSCCVITIVVWPSRQAAARESRTHSLTAPGIAHACAQAQLMAEITEKRFFVMAITSFN
jgi:hypothetical protein